MVIVDLYPFEETVKKGGTQDEIIEKIDIGGIALIRAAAKNHKNVVCISSVNDYESFLEIYKNNNGQLSLDERKYFARNSFLTSSKYDSRKIFFKWISYWIWANKENTKKTK